MRPYKGYTGTIEFDEQSLVFHGRLVGIRDIVTFEADNARDLVAAFRDSVDDYLEFCAQKGKDPQKPFSGHLSLRINPDLHRKAVETAATQAKSLNQWIADTLSEATRDKNGVLQTRVSQ